VLAGLSEGWRRGLRVGCVTGDDLLAALSRLSKVASLTNLDDGRSFSELGDRVLSANAYLGAGPIVDALDSGANVVLTGRTTDTALVLGPLRSAFGWAADDWDRLAAGVVAGHLIECSAQVTGALHQSDWHAVPNLIDPGYPIVEVDGDGSFVVTKPEGTGGLVNRETVIEQLLYEIQDPRAFLTPDVTVDFTSIQVADLGADRVRISGVRGGPPPSDLKASITYHDGWMTTMLWPYTQPDPVAKATYALDRTEAAIRRLDLDISDFRRDIFGTGAILGPRAHTSCAPVEARSVVICSVWRSRSPRCIWGRPGTQASSVARVEP
jgi:hypothetical protein